MSAELPGGDQEGPELLEAGAELLWNDARAYWPEVMAVWSGYVVVMTEPVPVGVKALLRWVRALSLPTANPDLIWTMVLVSFGPTYVRVLRAIYASLCSGVNELPEQPPPL